jgi:hypothetical protein
LNRGPGLTLHYAANLPFMLSLAFLMYLKYIISPFEHPLFCDWPSINIPLSGLQQSVALLFLAAVAALLFWSFRKRKDLFFYLAGFSIMMIPYMNIIYYGLWVAQRYVYFTSLLLLAGPAWLLWQHYVRMGVPMRRVLQFAFAGYIAVSIFQIQAEQAKWRNTESLWSYEINTSHPSMLAYQGLAKVYARQLDSTTDPGLRIQLAEKQRELFEQGEAAYEALGVQPSPYLVYQPIYYAKLLNLRARLAGMTGALTSIQLGDYEKAFELNPNDIYTNSRLGEIYLDLAHKAHNPDRRAELAQKSLRHFLIYARRTLQNPDERRKNMNRLEQAYLREFPFLADEIAAFRRELPGY